MGKKKSKKSGNSSESDDDYVKLPKVPDRLSKPFAKALSGLKIEKKEPAPIAPPPAPSIPPVSKGRAMVAADEARAFKVAMSGVMPLGEGAKRVIPGIDMNAPKPKIDLKSDNDDARARLDALVGGGMKFDVSRDEDGRVQAVRSGKDASVLRELRARDARADATIDLHGMVAQQAEQELARFVREEYKKGMRKLLVVHGKGLHSEGGIGVLGDRAVHVLTHGGAAPLVHALVTAHDALGGRGALMVKLVERL